jgi:hypothetical protein
MQSQLLQIKIHDNITDVSDWNAYINISDVRDDLIIDLCQRGIKAHDGKFDSSFCIYGFKPFHETIITMLLSEYGPYWLELRGPTY